MVSEKLYLEWIEGEYQLLRFAANFKLPAEIYASPMITISRTKDETSILLPSDLAITFGKQANSSPLAGFRVSGTLDHNLIGILAKLSKILADAKIPIFAISTYDTDYIYVSTEQRIDAQAALVSGGYCFKP